MFTDDDYDGSSRWEFTRQRSKWHFNTRKPPEPGADSFYRICRFDADFAEAIATCKGRSKPFTWWIGDNQDLPPETLTGYDDPGNARDLVNAGADPHAVAYQQAPLFNRDEIPLFSMMARYLGLKVYDLRFQNQPPGSMAHTHIDKLVGYDNSDPDLDRYETRRFAVMLADWEMGQVFQIGNGNFSQWRAGDCITWEGKDTPHSTANMGWGERPMLRITGYATAETHRIMAEGSADRIVKLEGRA